MGEPVKLYRDGEEQTLYANSQVAAARADGWSDVAPEPTGSPPNEDTPSADTPLPLDLPAYDALIAADLTTVEAVLAHADLTDLDGIGEKLAGRIVAALAEFGVE